jgi:dTDP-4-amino-4,6-dideoxygalactose transaminase
MITPRTTGIIGVHLWGRAAPVDELQAIADEHGLRLMFDAAHAFGSTYKGKSIGRFGACEVFSFHATKSFNTFEGGAITTNDDELAETMRLMRNFGFKGYDNVIHPGTNGKMIEVCAAMGLTNLDAFSHIVTANTRNYHAYREALNGIPDISLLSFDPAERNSHHYVVLEVGEGCPVTRDEIVATLHAENVLARKYFWPGSHKMQPYRSLFPHAGLMLYNTQRIAEHVVILPTGTAIESDTIESICSIIHVLVSRPS